jgi:hypothetical protein
VKNQFLFGLFIAATMAPFSISLAATPPEARMSETSATVSQFAASHQRVKAKLTAQDREILVQLSAKIRKSLPRNAQIPGDVIKILSASTHGLSQEEIDALASYVSGEISSQGSSQASPLQATQQMQETQMSFNLQYLQLQTQMQNENRAYTMVSNIMKTKHDTVKNTISNIR